MPVEFAQLFLCTQVTARKPCLTLQACIMNQAVGDTHRHTYFLNFLSQLTGSPEQITGSQRFDCEPRGQRRWYLANSINHVNGLHHLCHFGLHLTPCLIPVQAFGPEYWDTGCVLACAVLGRYLIRRCIAVPSGVHCASSSMPNTKGPTARSLWNPLFLLLPVLPLPSIRNTVLLSRQLWYEGGRGSPQLSWQYAPSTQPNSGRRPPQPSILPQSLSRLDLLYHGY
mmetsp:Transcript_140912/g.245575  ORF Transcript_140912/g.245575 Transcript_140912/m.245575 type:complete len:226 (-) Transcript_140912:165-842(-)